MQMNLLFSPIALPLFSILRLSVGHLTGTFYLRISLSHTVIHVSVWHLSVWHLTLALQLHTAFALFTSAHRIFYSAFLS